MGKKLSSFYEMKKLGLNFFEFETPKTFNEFRNILNNNKLCTIRTDAQNKDIDDLPFYIFNKII